MRWRNLVLLLLIIIFSNDITHAQNSGSISQWVQIEEFSDTLGVSWPALGFKSNNPHTALQNCGNNDWIKFNEISFLEGEFDSISLYYWSSWPQNPVGSSINFRTESPSGPIIATFNKLPMTSQAQEGNPARITTSLKNITGQHIIYITFSGGENICDLDKFLLFGKSKVTSEEAAKVWYVDAMNGSDTVNDGRTLSTPFKSIQKAAMRMRPGNICYIRAGIYRETVKPLYSGLSGSPMRFEAYNNENVVISGADSITGWKNYKGNIYQAKMP